MKLMTLALLALSLQFSSCAYMHKKKCDGDTCKVTKECSKESCKVGKKDKKSCSVSKS